MAGISSRSPRRRPRTELEGFRRGWVAIALLLGAGCAHHPPAAAGANAADEVVLVVENHHWNDVVVSVLHDGIVDRIGLVQAVKTSRLVIPSRRLGSSGLIQLRAHAVGAPDDHTSDTFPIKPGQEIQWTLESDLSRSSVAVH
jgi:hypothetical protein